MAWWFWAVWNLDSNDGRFCWIDSDGFKKTNLGSHKLCNVIRCGEWWFRKKNDIINLDIWTITYKKIIGPHYCRYRTAQNIGPLGRWLFVKFHRSRIWTHGQVDQLYKTRTRCTYDQYDGFNYVVRFGPEPNTLGWEVLITKEWIYRYLTGPICLDGIEFLTILRNVFLKLAKIFLNCKSG